MNRLLKEGHIEKIDDIKDDVFIQPTVITVKKDHSVKIALDGRALNHEIDKDKYQMSNLDNLLDLVAEKLDTEEGEAWFSLVDMTYAYDQVLLHQLTAKHCNFQIIGGKSTGTYRFITGFYGLSVMPREFQTSRDRPKSAPYPRLKNSKKTSKCQVFVYSSRNSKIFRIFFFWKNYILKKWTEWRAGARYREPLAR